MIVWRKREANPWLHEAEQVVKEIVPQVSHEETDQVHCGPGPFSMAGPDLVSDVLHGVGYADVRFERVDEEICIGDDVDEAIEFAMQLGPAGEIMRLSGDDGRKLEGVVESALREALGGYVRDDGTVWAPRAPGSSTHATPAEPRHR
jgi:hypothetical protein